MTKTNTEVVEIVKKLIPVDYMDNEEEVERVKGIIEQTLQAKDTQAEEMIQEVLDAKTTVDSDGLEAVFPSDIETIAQKYGIDLT